MKKLLLLFAFTAGFLNAEAQRQYLITFKDKGPEAAYFRQHPAEIFSEKSLARRKKHHVLLKEEDLPVSAAYVRQLQENGIEVKQKSKWLNAVFIETGLDGQTLRQRFPAIKNLKAYGVSQAKTTSPKFTAASASSGNSRLNYGASAAQIDQLNLDCLHDKGYQGKGVLIAVFDTGFPGVNTVAAYDSLRQQNRILATRNFVSKPTSVYGTHDHGAMVLSIIAANRPGVYVGGAAQATFALALTEYLPTETHQEELNWAAAAEWADSLGADIIQSSLSYKYFDPGQGDYGPGDIDGDTPIITRAADKAASKGILVVNGAGNDGTLTSPLSPHVGAPCDGDSVLCVGSVTFSNQYSNFSSRGPTADNRIKPDVVARGSGTALILPNGGVSATNGTSLSAPLISSLAACLLQANPTASNMGLYHAIKSSADKFTSPNTQFGWGLPDACKADSLLKTLLSAPEKLPDEPFKIYPTFFQDKLTLEAGDNGRIMAVSLYAVTGRQIILKRFPPTARYVLQLENPLPAGMYLLRIEEANGRTYQRKVVKQ